MTATPTSDTTFTIMNTKPFEFSLELFPNELGRFAAVSETRFVCRDCETRFTRSPKKQSELGDVCGWCNGKADRVRYLVDVCQPGGKPQCTCESYTTKRGAVECKHGAAALYLFGKIMAAKLSETNKAKL